MLNISGVDRHTLRGAVIRNTIEEIF